MISNEIEKIDISLHREVEDIIRPDKWEQHHTSLEEEALIELLFKIIFKLNEVIEKLNSLDSLERKEDEH